MTRAEYLEFVEEGLAFPETGVGSPNPASILYDHEEVILRLRAAHVEYCRKVASILEIDRSYHEEGGPEDEVYYGFAPAPESSLSTEAMRQMVDSQHMASAPNFKPVDTEH